MHLCGCCLWVIKINSLHFLNNNHVQGFVKGSTVCYGLYLNDELVQIMSLGNQDIVSHINGNLLEIVLRKIILLEVVSLGFGNIS